MSPKPAVTAHTIRAALRIHYPSGAYAVLEEVRNRTGYGSQERYADALVCSCWPSRGLWLAGVEIKVSRSDWKHELERPAKSAEIQRWCDYWWVAAPVGIVQAGELPVTWGLIEYDPSSRSKSKLTVRTEAPKLEATPPSVAFVASILRNVSASQEEAVKEAARAARTEALAECGGDGIDELKRELERTKNMLANSDQNANSLRGAAEELRQLKVLMGARWGGGAVDAEKALEQARTLRELGVPNIVASLRHAADALEGPKS